MNYFFKHFYSSFIEHKILQLWQWMQCQKCSSENQSWLWRSTTSHHCLWNQLFQCTRRKYCLLWWSKLSCSGTRWLCWFPMWCQKKGFNPGRWWISDNEWCSFIYHPRQFLPMGGRSKLWIRLLQGSKSHGNHHR